MGDEDASSPQIERGATVDDRLTAPRRLRADTWLAAFVLAALIAALFARPVAEMANTWALDGSYYSHGFLIPPVTAYLIWTRRRDLARLRASHDNRGYLLVLLAGAMLWAGAFLGFRVFEQAALMPMLFGVLLVLLGCDFVKTLRFPLAFLVFMIPIPPSLTQTFAFRIKIVATEGAVVLANVFGLHMLRHGSYIHFGNDRILIGEICGGLRSLIALIALGALLAYWSKTRTWARAALFLTSVPIAIGANVFRIFLLCVVGYFFGSRSAGGLVHNVSGLLLFAIAFGMFCGIETLLRRLAPETPPRRRP